MLARIANLLFLSAALLPAQRMAPTYASFQAFLDSCPQNDPYIGVIRRDFQILRNGAAAAPIACTEPYSKMPAAQITEELTIVQGLRFAYYMDMGQSGYLPWTPLRLYDWFKSRVAGFNVDTTLNPGTVAASCCITTNGRLFIVESTISNDANRAYRQTPDGLAAQVALIAHETRHSEGTDYSHVGCCGIANGCDQTYDEKNLSPYGIQYYLAKQWLTGAINLGYSCDPATRAQLASAFQGLANVYPSRFCDIKPPALSLPPAPGGSCIASCILSQGAGAANIAGNGGASTLGIVASTTSCGWTADSADAWIFQNSGSNSLGSGTATFGGLPNQGNQPRSGTMIAGGLKIPVTQAGCSPCTPAVTITSVVSGAAYVTGLASGSWVTIYGNNLSSTSRLWAGPDFVGNKLPFSLDGVSVRIDGQPAAVYYISPTQLDVQMPDDGAVGTMQVQVLNQMGSATATTTLQRYAPAFFDFTGKYVAAVHLDGTLVGPAGLFGPTLKTAPVKPGELVSIYGTGFGPTDPPAGAGVAFSGAAPLAFPNLLVRIGGQVATVQFAGLIAAGLYQLNVYIPSVPDGDLPVVASFGTTASASSLSIAVLH